MNQPLSMIRKYAGYFHDGDITQIKHANNEIELWMESAEILPEWNEDNVPLSKHNTITGKLLLQGIRVIKKNNRPYSQKFRIKHSYDKANIYHFGIDSKTIDIVPPVSLDTDLG